ncbi:MAG: hypothetical protein EBR30_07980 [Cytophagia bacterium]|nr:hypothetical protein [Cytophagia bacterium]
MVAFKQSKAAESGLNTKKSVFEKSNFATQALTSLDEAHNSALLYFRHLWSKIFNAWETTNLWATQN